MNFFDPMAAAVDWLDAYRAASPSIVDLYADDASLDCDCTKTSIAGRAAIAAYWQQRFGEMPAGELEDLQPDGTAIVVTYRVRDELVQASLNFNDDGKIKRSECGAPQAPERRRFA
jgi:hypothetical protein